MRYTISQSPSETLVALHMASPLDDSQRVLTALAGELGKSKGKIAFDMSGVAYFNSPAIRHWVLFVDALTRPYSFRRCSAYFIEYGNMVHQIFGKGTVESFHAPYRCGACSHEFEAPHETAAVDPDAGLPEARCPKCGKSSKPSVSASDFLFFMAP